MPSCSISTLPSWATDFSLENTIFWKNFVFQSKKCDFAHLKIFFILPPIKSVLATPIILSPSPFIGRLRNRNEKYVISECSGGSKKKVAPKGPRQAKNYLKICEDWVDGNFYISRVFNHQSSFFRLILKFLKNLNNNPLKILNEPPKKNFSVMRKSFQRKISY